ncbi:MAG TPA: hypothetical protein VHS96_16855, partial [Bacteroidia bacterium]|nr:hypothetical protein [Bacteroidia bacterium]
MANTMPSANIPFLRKFQVTVADKERPSFPIVDWSMSLNLMQPNSIDLQLHDHFTLFASVQAQEIDA